MGWRQRGIREGQRRIPLFLQTLIFPCGRGINRFLRRRDEYDIAIGSREATGAVRYDEPAFRHFTGGYSTRW